MENSSHYIFFSAADGNLLIWVLIALILGVAAGNWFPKKWEKSYVQCVWPGVLASIVQAALTCHWLMTAALGLSYLLILTSYYFALIRWPEKEQRLRAGKYMLLVTAAIVVWSLFAPGFKSLWTAIQTLMQDYKASLILMGYLTMLWPTSYIVKFCLLGIVHSVPTSTQASPSEPDAERGGRMIGMFERVIIFTLVLLGEFSAIGFLITGKSIIRFAQANEKLRSEYVLVGTMVSYAVAILAGVGVKWLLKLA